MCPSKPSKSRKLSRIEQGHFLSGIQRESRKQAWASVGISCWPLTPAQHGAWTRAGQHAWEQFLADWGSKTSTISTGIVLPTSTGPWRVETDPPLAERENYTYWDPSRDSDEQESNEKKYEKIRPITNSKSKRFYSFVLDFSDYAYLYVCIYREKEHNI